MIMHKGLSNKKVHQEAEFMLSDVILDHHFVQTVTMHENNEEHIVQHGIKVLANYILRFGFKKYNEGRKKKLVEIMLKHPEVFRMDNILNHRKKLVKDAKYAEKEKTI
jgi:hypothetical protein